VGVDDIRQLCPFLSRSMSVGLFLREPLREASLTSAHPFIPSPLRERGRCKALKSHPLTQPLPLKGERRTVFMDEH
jgi:hypothetical protein